MALIGRILIILVAFFAASLAAGIVLVFSIVFPEWGSGRFGFDEGSFAVVATIGFVVIGSFGFLPALIIALVTEALNIRSALIYATGGAVLGALSYLGIARFDPGYHDHGRRRPPRSRDHGRRRHHRGSRLLADRRPQCRRLARDDPAALGALQPVLIHGGDVVFAENHQHLFKPS